MAILEDVKLALRVINTNFDSEVSDIIESCKLDLKEGGVIDPDETDKLVKRAIVLYSKANFGASNPEMEKNEKQYHKVKVLLCSAKKYTTGVV